MSVTKHNGTNRVKPLQIKDEILQAINLSPNLWNLHSWMTSHKVQTSRAIEFFTRHNNNNKLGSRLLYINQYSQLNKTINIS